MDLWVEEDFNAGSRVVVSAARAGWFGSGGRCSAVALGRAVVELQQRVARYKWTLPAVQRGSTAVPTCRQGCTPRSCLEQHSLSHPLVASPTDAPPPLPRTQGGSYAWKGGVAGFGSGEGPSAGDVPRHRVKIYNYHQDMEFDLEVPEDRCGLCVLGVCVCGGRFLGV